MRSLITGNWKMYGLAPQLEQTKAFAASVKAAPPLADALIAAKMTAARAAGLSTIICIAQTKEQRNAGKALVVCGGQLAETLRDLLAGCETSIAYESLWAIGSGHMPVYDDVVAIHVPIRSGLVERFGDAG